MVTPASGSDAARRRCGAEPILRADSARVGKGASVGVCAYRSSCYGQIRQEQRACPGEAGFAAANRSVRIELVYLAVSPSWPNAAAS